MIYMKKQALFSLKKSYKKQPYILECLEQMLLRLGLQPICGLFYHNSLDRSIANSRVSHYYLLFLFFVEIPVGKVPHTTASDLGLHYLPVTFIGVSRLK